jgi:hypothetical protein
MGRRASSLRKVKHNAGEHGVGRASTSYGPHEITPEHMKITDGKLPAHVPPPDAELHPTKITQESPR